MEEAHKEEDGGGTQGGGWRWRTRRRWTSRMMRCTRRRIEKAYQEEAYEEAEEAY
jgi:hypothetical protein